MSADDWGRLAFRVTSRICFPRFPGTEGEALARERISDQFEKAGLKVEAENFTCSDFAIRVAARWAVVPTGALLLVSALLLYHSLFAPAIILAGASLLPAAYVISRAETGFHRPGRQGRYKTANVVGRLAGEREGGPMVLLTAHYDSKSQAFPIWLRVLLFIVTGLGSILLVLLVIAGSIIGLLGVPCPFTISILAAAFILFVLDLSFLLNTVGNLSDGALDNATGVGIITEMGRRLAQDPPGGLRLRVVATAAEEIGLCGANAFLEAHREELDPGRTVVINFDGCGGERIVRVLSSYGIPPQKTPKDLVALVDRISRDEGIPVKWTYIPFGLATDLMPFRKAGFKGIDFIGLAGKSHTTRDRINLVREGALADYVRVGVELVRKLCLE